MSRVSHEIDVNSSSTVCRMCGMAYGKLSGFFYRSYAAMWKGTGYLPICKNCLDELYEAAYIENNYDSKVACRKICRKLDIYWSEVIYDQVIKRSSSRTVMAGYLATANAYKYAGKSYDDTLKEEALEQEAAAALEAEKVEELVASPESELEPEEEIVYDISDDVKLRWGSGYTDRMYHELETRWSYWVSKLNDDGVDTSTTGIQALLRQIVATELDINRGRAAGEDVDKKVNTLNNLVGSAMLKPSQNKAVNEDPSIDSTPLGVWVYKWEHYRPCPDIDDNLKDTSGILNTVHTWLFGHLAKMVNLKNSYCKMYEDAIEKLKVERPEYIDEDDDTIISSMLENEDDG